MHTHTHIYFLTEIILILYKCIYRVWTLYNTNQQNKFFLENLPLKSWSTTSLNEENW